MILSFSSYSFSSKDVDYEVKRREGIEREEECGVFFQASYYVRTFTAVPKSLLLGYSFCLPLPRRTQNLLCVCDGLTL